MTLPSSKRSNSLIKPSGGLLCKNYFRVWAYLRGGLFHSSDKWSVRHVDFERISKLLSLMTYFLKAAQANQLSATVNGKQKYEVGLVVPTKYTAVTNSKTVGTTLAEKLIEKRDRYRNSELKFNKSFEIVNYLSDNFDS